MKRLVLFLGERDLLYTQLLESLGSEGVGLIAFDSMSFKKVFDDQVSYLDLSNQLLLENYIKKECDQYEAITFVISDDFQWHNNNVSDYITTIERLLYGAVFTTDILIKNNFKSINVIITVNRHHDEKNMTDVFYESAFDHVNRVNHSLNAHLIYLLHDTAYNIDSYAKIEFGYTDKDEEKLKTLLNKKIEKVTNIIISVINDEQSVNSSIVYIKD